MSNVFINHFSLKYTKDGKEYFNTSNVFINPVPKERLRAQRLISIHLMFLLIIILLQQQEAREYFNTSNVFINQSISHLRPLRIVFQYI